MKTFLLVAALCAVAVSGNPAINTEWRWKLRTPTVTPNVNAMPYETLVKSFVKEPRVPGTKTVYGCGPIKTNGNDRIVGGQEAVPHSYPWQVALYIDDMYFCGGSLISADYILTAGHCLYQAREVIVVLGAHNLQEYEPSQVTVVSNDLTVHEGYGAAMLVNDLSLIRLPTPITFNEFIAPVCLPSYSSDDVPAGTYVTSSGWGITFDGAWAISNVLNEVTNAVITNDLCNSVYGSVVTDATICTNSQGGHGTCSGDSGGPLNYQKNGKSYTAAITSFVSSAGCQSGYPDGFTRTASYLDWIETNTGIAMDP